MHVIVPCNVNKKKIQTVIHHFFYTVPLKLKQFNTCLGLWRTQLHAFISKSSHSGMFKEIELVS